MARHSWDDSDTGVIATADQLKTIREDQRRADPRRVDLSNRTAAYEPPETPPDASSAVSALVTPEVPVKPYALDALDRAARTVLQVGASFYLIGQQSGSPIDIKALAAIVGSSALLSILTSLLSAPSFFNYWWYQVIERAVKTFAQTMVAAFGTSAVGSQIFPTLPQNFSEVLSACGVAALTSVVTSVFSTTMGESSQRVDLLKLDK